MYHAQFMNVWVMYFKHMGENIASFKRLPKSCKFKTKYGRGKESNSFVSNCFSQNITKTISNLAYKKKKKALIFFQFFLLFL